MIPNTRILTCSLLTLSWLACACSSGASNAVDNSNQSASAAQSGPQSSAGAQSVARTAGDARRAGPPADQASMTMADGAAAPSASPADTGAPAAGSGQPSASGNGSADSDANSGTGVNHAAPASDAQPSASADPAQPTQATSTTPDELDHTKDIRGTCDLKTSFPDDHACIAPPKPGEGFQIHVGPSSYDDPEEVAKFIIKPGEEKTECYTFRTDNEEMLTFQTAVLSGRAGTHHIINTVWSGELPTGEFTDTCGSGVDVFDPNAPQQVGSLPGASKAYMERRSVAPEFADVGRTVPAKALVTSDMHYYNFTDQDILREFWINVYFPPAEAKITRYADDIATFGGLGWNSQPIQPGTDMVYKYECPITGDGFIMNLLGHYHLHGRRFGISIKRKSGMVEKVFEMYDPQDPAVFDYNSITMNPPFSELAAGAYSGILPVSDGDTFQWECHIINDDNFALGYTNEVKTGEMCNAWGFSVGIDPLQCGVP